MQGLMAKEWSIMINQDFIGRPSHGLDYVLNLKPLMLLSFFTMILMNYLKNLQKHLCIYFKVSTHTFLPFFSFILIPYDDL